MQSKHRFLFLPVCVLALLATASAAQAQTLATGDALHVFPPHYPAVCTWVRAQFSTSQRATPPATDDTARLQAALDQCANSGKAVVLLPSAGNDAFFTGTLDVKGESVIVAYGVTLFGNNTYDKELLDVSGVNPGIYGPGTIDGRGDIVNTLNSNDARLIEANNTTNLTVAWVTLRQAAEMHLYIEGGSGARVWQIRVDTPANTKNTDGIDLDSLTNAIVFGSNINDGDDGVAVKTNSGPASNITVVDNRFYGTHGISIGSQTMYGVNNVLWENNILYGTDHYGLVSSDNNGIRIKTDYTCGGPVNQVTYRNTLLVGVKHLLIFNTSYGSCSGNPGIPVFTDIVVDGLRAVNSQSGAYSEFEGYNAANPLNLYLAHVNLDQTNQDDSQYAIVGLDDSNITPAGPGVTTYPFQLREGERFDH